MDKKKGGCEYFPEITNCVECEYFCEVETDYDIVTKCEMYDIELAKKRKKTFAEWSVEYLKTHPSFEITLRSDFGYFNECVLQMYHRAPNGKQSVAQKVIMHELLDRSNMSCDEILIYSAEELRKELEKYGCKS